MMTQYSTTHMSLPPPPTHSLVDLDREVGWTNGRTIGFTGFANAHEAASAAWLAYRTITRRLAEDGKRPVLVDTKPLTLEHRDGSEVIVRGDTPIASLIRPGVGSRAGVDWYAFEIEVPPSAHDARVHGLAHLAYRALRRSGILWSLWRMPEHVAPSPAATESALVTTPPRTFPSAPVFAGGLLLATTLSALLLLLLGSTVRVLSATATIAAVLAIAMVSAVLHRWRRGIMTSVATT